MFFLYTVGEWVIAGASEFDRNSDLQTLQNKIELPVIGCSLVCACAAWATFAPAGTFRFARSLAIIFAVCVPVWFILGHVVNTMGAVPLRLKGTHHPTLYPIEWILLMAPPILVTAILTATRISNARRRGTPDSHAAFANPQ